MIDAIAITEVPYCANLSSSVEQALQEQAKAMFDAYYSGNKSTARAMMNTVMDTRKLYVGMWFQIFATQAGVGGKGYAFICSVTA